MTKHLEKKTNHVRARHWKQGPCSSVVNVFLCAGRHACLTLMRFCAQNAEGNPWLAADMPILHYRFADSTFNSCVLSGHDRI